MPLTKTVLHNGVIIAGGNSGGISTGLIAGACEVCLIVECIATTGVSSILEIKNSINAVFVKAVYGVAGSLQNNGGFYNPAGVNHDSFVAENTGTENLNVKITLVSTEVLTLIPVLSQIPIQTMLNKEEILRLVALQTGKKCIDIEPVSVKFSSAGVPVWSNYIYFGQVELWSTSTSIVTVVQAKFTLSAGTSPNLNGDGMLMNFRSSFDGISTNQMTKTNVIFNGITISSGIFQGMFTGYRIKVE